MAGTTIMPILDDPQPNSSGGRVRTMLRRLGREGLADLRSLFRVLHSTWLLFRRRRRRACVAGDLDGVHEEIGRLAIVQPGSRELPTQADAIVSRSRLTAAETALAEARSRQSAAEATLARRRTEAKAVLGYLDEEARDRRHALSAADSRARSGGADSAPDSAAAGIALEDLRQSAAEADAVRSAREAEWRADATELTAELQAAAAAVNAAAFEKATSEKVLREACRELGRDIHRAGDAAPELVELLHRAEALDREVDRTEQELDRLREERQADRRRALRATVVLGLAFALVLGLVLAGRSFRADGGATIGERSGAPVANASSPAQAPAPRRSSAGSGRPANLDWPNEALTTALLSLPEFAPGPDGIASLRPLGTFQLESRSPVAGGFFRLQIRAAVERCPHDGEAWTSDTLLLVVLADAEDRLIEPLGAVLTGPEDDELFRLLEQRP